MRTAWGVAVHQEGPALDRAAGGPERDLEGRRRAVGQCPAECGPGEERSCRRWKGQVQHHSRCVPRAHPEGLRLPDCDRTEGQGDGRELQTGKSFDIRRLDAGSRIAVLEANVAQRRRPHAAAERPRSDAAASDRELKSASGRVSSSRYRRSRRAAGRRRSASARRRNLEGAGEVQVTRPEAIGCRRIVGIGVVDLDEVRPLESPDETPALTFATTPSPAAKYGRSPGGAVYAQSACSA